MVDPAASPLSFFASEMVRLRNVAGLSQPALARRLNYSASQVAKIETCQRIPKRGLAGRLDEILDRPDGARLWAVIEESVEPGRVAVRDSKDRYGSEITVSDRAWSAFVRGVRDGEFDLG